MTRPCYTPAALRSRHDGWNAARQSGFLQALADGLTVVAAAHSVGMSERAAYRLKRHARADGFRAAWRAAKQQQWQRRAQGRLDRVLYGELSVIERDGRVVATRRRPGSDRMMIQMLKAKLRAAQAQSTGQMPGQMPGQMAAPIADAAPARKVRKTGHGAHFSNAPGGVFGPYQRHDGSNPLPEPPRIVPKWPEPPPKYSF